MSLSFDQAEPAAFREAMGSFVSGVTIITVRDLDNRPNGMTANAFSSVSMDPLLILVCLNRDTRTYGEVSAVGRFGVNILDVSARGISDYCARPGLDKRLPAEWLHPVDHADHPPIIAGALAYLDCTVDEEIAAGTHSIVLGKVNAIGIADGDRQAPLVYYRGRYRQLEQSESVSV